jgi:hypothetical protein
MARPLVSRSELRQPFLLYLNEAEEEQIRASAQAARLPMSTYLRRLALRHPVQAAPAWQQLEFCRRELAPLANNLNQIARACNAGRAPEGIYPVVAALAEQVRRFHMDLLGVIGPPP